MSYLPHLRYLTILGVVVASLAGCALGGVSKSGPTGSSTTPKPESWDVTFRDVAAEAGIHYTLGHGKKSPLTILDVAPGGCALVDLDQDGWLDVVLVATPRCAVYHNLGNGRFEDVTAAWGLDREGPWMGCTVGDYDNDGYPDLFVTGYHRCALWHNEHGRRFKDVTREAGVQCDLWTTSAAFCDVDGDGWLDLYVGAYVDYQVGHQDLCLAGKVMTSCGPEMYGPERGRLFHNLKTGRFADITQASGLDQAAGKTWGVAFADYDDDGKPDLYLANDQVAGNLFHNVGGGKFRDVGKRSGTAYDAYGNVQGGMGVDWGDYDGDGRLDLFVSTYTHQAKQLYHNDGGGHFRVASEEAGIAVPTLPYVAFGGGFFDPNNDGFPDLLLANGHVRDNAEQADSSQHYAQPLQLLANGGHGAFTDVSLRAGVPFQERLVGRGVAFGDYDNDGREDALVVDLEGRARLLHNEGGPRCGHWLTVQLEGGPLNRHGIGARVTVEAGGRKQVREVAAGRSVLSACDTRLHFGLGTATKVERVTVRWPNGRWEEWLDRPADRFLTLRAGSGRPLPSQ